MAASCPSLRRFLVKAVIGSVVFLVSLFLMRRILVDAGVLSSTLALLPRWHSLATTFDPSDTYALRPSDTPWLRRSPPFEPTSPSVT
jgi:hypothetical protein